MRICVISANVFAVGGHQGLQGYGGLEVVAWNCAKGLAAKGHQVSLVAPQGSECPGVQMIHTGPPGQWDEGRGYGGYKERDSLGKEYMPYPGYWHHLPGHDVIIDHSWSKYSFMLKQEGRLPAPILAVCHAPVDTMFRSIPAGVEKFCAVCISKDQAAHFEGLFNRPARVCYNGVDMDFYKPLGLPRNNRFLFLARFSSIKGPDIAIEACRKAGVGLDLVGDTSITNEPELYQKCKEMADGEQIRIVGPCSRGETVHWYSQNHCMIHPNQRFREPFGLAPVEAMACGMPVIAWDNGAMRETVKNGKTGWIADSMESLLLGIQSFGAGVGDTCRNHCREWAAQFSMPNMVNRYEELCTEALSTGGW